MKTLVFFLLAVFAYPPLHIGNGLFFNWAEISSNISLVYLPAFLRLFNLLVFGPLYGTVATTGGGLLLQWWTVGYFVALDYFQIACSAFAPLLAVGFFYGLRKRVVSISSPQDLIEIAVLSGISNTLMHHLYWAFSKENEPVSISQMWFMALGDWVGILVGVVAFTIVLRILKTFFKQMLE